MQRSLSILAEHFAVGTRVFDENIQLVVLELLFVCPSIRFTIQGEFRSLLLASVCAQALELDSRVLVVEFAFAAHGSIGIKIRPWSMSTGGGYFCVRVVPKCASDESRKGD